MNNRAFVASVLAAVALFTIVRFELLPITGAIAVFFEICAAIGGGVVLGLMAFGFLGRTVAIIVGTIAVVVMLPVFIGSLRDYIVLMASLTAYGASATICVALSLRNRERFDFSVLADRVTSFHQEQDDLAREAPSNQLAADTAGR